MRRKYTPFFPFFLVMVSMFLAACGSMNDMDTRYVGVSDYSQYSLKSGASQYESTKKMRKEQEVENALIKGDLFELSLLDVRFASVIEGVLQEMVSDKGNELGVFVTLEELPRLDKEGKPVCESRTLLDKRLVFSSFSRGAFENTNSDNVLIYRGMYNGGDLRLLVEVVEFDKEAFTVAKDVAKEVYDSFANKAMGEGNIPSIVSQLIDTVGGKIYSYVTRDDLILSRSFRLVPTGHALNSDTEQFYLTEGHILISRVSRESPLAYENITWDKINVLSESVEGVKDKYISYVLLQLYKIRGVSE